ncbi:prolipoprotein diacylglyceryl transferase [Flavonifractor sp. An82]|uniref:prolipoprotein diacylglyceryl transferase n=1 Tax=Flavonifractor sp. An82 TaxID=1965660 RepID=UPI000B37A5DF|nr:prolipoprotein diacylglyceryl transferase [Flavonifractor sp. An82]OUN23963.1 prolipoprotein diacylglyceryl transferase [Flavonifractor sp. An82]
MMGTVSFPGLGLELTLNRVAFHLGSWPVYWYGIIIAAGFLLAVVFCSRKASQFGIRQDDIIDMLFFAVPLSIIGARLYYIIFYLDLYRREDGSLDFGAMVRIWDGGLAIYGGVIAAVITLFVFCKVRKIKFLAFADLGVFGMLIGQMIGRWGNFVNIEAYGGPTDLPWRMGIYQYVDGVRQYVEVHPTFLYESLWNLVGLGLLILIAKKWRKFDGQLFLSYFAWYGVGRGFIEGLRTDSLYFFNTPIRVSQVFGFATAAISIVLLIVLLGFRKHDPANLWVNQMKAHPRLVALVYQEGKGEAWMDKQKKRLERDFARIEAYALPADAPAEDKAELIAALKERSDLKEVLVMEEKKK